MISFSFALKHHHHNFDECMRNTDIILRKDIGINSTVIIANCCTMIARVYFNALVKLCREKGIIYIIIDEVSSKRCFQFLAMRRVFVVVCVSLDLSCFFLFCIKRHCEP